MGGEIKVRKQTNNHLPPQNDAFLNICGVDNLHVS